MSKMGMFPAVDNSRLRPKKDVHQPSSTRLPVKVLNREFLHTGHALPDEPGHNHPPAPEIGTLTHLHPRAGQKQVKALPGFVSPSRHRADNQAGLADRCDLSGQA